MCIAGVVVMSLIPALRWQRQVDRSKFSNKMQVLKGCIVSYTHTQTLVEQEFIKYISIIYTGGYESFHHMEQEAWDSGELSTESTSF